MSASHPSFLDPHVAAERLIASLPDPEQPHTVADAAAASGLALRDAERGLTWLTKEYRGHLRVTESGELLYLFPTKFTQPWKTRDAFDRALRKGIDAAVGLGRFLVRAWLLIALATYVVVFVVILIAMMFAQQNGDDRRRGSSGGAGAMLGGLLRVLGDAFFWMWSPFSPFYVNRYEDPRMYGGYTGYVDGGPARSRRGANQGNETPFYEKVNSFVFGPAVPKVDPSAQKRAVLAELRAQKGRIGLGDVMRVTGLPRHEADPLMAELMLDYEGDVAVSDEGGLVYHFEAMRKTASESPGTPPRPPAAWDAVRPLPSLTGNSSDDNLLIGGLNAFNLVMSYVALSTNLTLAKIPWLVFRHIPLARLPYDGVPIVLGVVPLVFSLALFLLPVARAAIRPWRERRAAAEKGRLAVLREVLTRVKSKAEVTDAALERAWTRAVGEPPKPGEVSAQVAALGADVATDGQTGGIRYRFADLETEAIALDRERDAADEEEKRVGQVVFRSDD